MMRSAMATYSRRAFLVLAVLLAPAPRVRGWARQTPASAPRVSPDEFLRLSQRLVGRPNLDATLATTYLNALLSEPANIPRLAELSKDAVADLTPAHLALERTIIEWWYTGVCTIGGERRLATHTGALMWAALGMPAPGTCAAPFGAWSRPPRPIA
jgi:hypothetical protein